MHTQHLGPPGGPTAVAAGCLCALALTAWAPPAGAAAYFGFSGLSFVPSADVVESGEVNLSYYSRPSQLTQGELDLLPFSVQAVFGIGWDRLELGLTNTYLFLDHPEAAGAEPELDLSNTGYLLPVSLKAQLIRPDEDNGYTSVALGAASPYGGYAALSKRLDVPGAMLRLHGAFSSNFVYHSGAFGGVEVTPRIRLLEDLSRFSLQVEGGYRGTSTEREQTDFWGPALNETWGGGGVRFAWLDQLSVMLGVRWTLLDDPRGVDPDREVLHGYVALSYDAVFWNRRPAGLAALDEGGRR